LQGSPAEAKLEEQGMAAEKIHAKNPVLESAKLQLGCILISGVGKLKLMPVGDPLRGIRAAKISSPR
jgi:hypothetical protein